MSDEKKPWESVPGEEAANAALRDNGISGEITAEGAVSLEEAEGMLGFKLGGIDAAEETVAADGEIGEEPGEIKTPGEPEYDGDADDLDGADAEEETVTGDDDVDDAASEPVAKKPEMKPETKEKRAGLFEQMEMREPKQKEVRKKGKGEKKSAGEYVGEVIEETKRVTWPTKPEILKWSLVVLAALAFFMLFTFLVDTFIANPITYGISGLASGEGFGRKAIILSVLFVLTGLGSAAGVMLHAGGDQNGLSDGLSASLTGGSAVAEKNLDRLTIVMIVLFTLTTIAMMIWFPLGTMGN